MSVPPSKIYKRNLFEAILVWEGTWSAINEYTPGMVVVGPDGHVYVCLALNFNEQPPNTLYWQALNS